MCGKIVTLFLVAFCCAIMVHHVTFAAIGPQCLLPLERGPCRAMIVRYGYDSETHRCEQFVYGGCQGNQNNFLNLGECEKICG